jgi:hypothetical protein
LVQLLRKRLDLRQEGFNVHCSILHEHRPILRSPWNRNGSVIVAIPNSSATDVDIATRKAVPASLPPTGPTRWSRIARGFVILGS